MLFHKGWNTGLKNKKKSNVEIHSLLILHRPTRKHFCFTHSAAATVNTLCVCVNESGVTLWANPGQTQWKTCCGQQSSHLGLCFCCSSKRDAGIKAAHSFICILRKRTSSEDVLQCFVNWHVLFICILEPFISRSTDRTIQICIHLNSKSCLKQHVVVPLYSRHWPGHDLLSGSDTDSVRDRWRVSSETPDLPLKSYQMVSVFRNLLSDSNSPLTTD